MPTTYNTHVVAVNGAQLRGWSWSTVANVAALPATGQPGEIQYVTATGLNYQWSPVESRWLPWFQISNSSWKQPARAIATTNITVASPGAAIDGVTLAAGDRVVLAGQTAGAENGIYVFNGAAAALTRATDLDGGTEASGANIFITEGTTNANRQYQQTADNVTIGTTAQTWTLVGPVTGVAAASDTVAGIVELATNAEAITGTDTVRAITPANLAAVLADGGGTATFGGATTGTIAHGVTGITATDRLLIEVTDAATGFPVSVDITNDATNITWTTVTAPAANAYRATWRYALR